MKDILFISPNNARNIYQNLSTKYSAIEPPTWALLLSESCRSKDFSVAILDCLAENLSADESYKRIIEINPRIICFVVYGQNVNAGTTNMSGATYLSSYLKEKNVVQPICFVGSHIQALPVETLNNEKSIDIGLCNEGVYSIWNLLKLKNYNFENLKKIKGIVFRSKNEIVVNEPEVVVPQERMDIDLPGYAWDLLPKDKKPLDLYRSPMWHAEYDEDKRSPYAALQSSLGCQFKCDFCMINIINRNDNDEIGVASNYSKMRFWSTDFIIKEFKKLYDYGVRTIRIVDEMFLLNPKYYKPLCEELKKINKDDDLRMWAYSRIDTVKNPEILDLVRSAGIKWLCLGIESGNKNIRLEVSKGKFEDVDVKKIVEQIHDADIEVMANYIFGLPGDDKESMKETFDLSKELCTSGWNTYAAMALPGSKLYKLAVQNNHKLPENYEGYSFHSYNTQPLPTEKLKPYEILSYRDKCFEDYHNDVSFLKRIEKKYGKKAAQNIVEMSKIKLKRRIIEESNKD
jgi:anaerobic magnesium-protoporphyrin IX monomethyl ester cyclase